MTKFLQLFILFSAFNAFGQTQKISFEASENYSLGTINSQQNWKIDSSLDASFFKVIKTVTTDGEQAVEVKSDGNFTSEDHYVYHDLPNYNRISISADVKFEAKDGSNYYALSLYDGSNWAGGFNVMFTGKIYADTNDEFKEIGVWEANKWYNLKIEIDHVLRKIYFYLENEKVFERDLYHAINRVNELNFEFDNDGSGFTFDHIIIQNLDDLSANEFISQESITIYPNPIVDFLNISSSSKVISVDVVDVIGRKVKSITNTTRINLQNLPKGVYFLKIKLENGKTEIQKIIKK